MSWKSITFAVGEVQDTALRRVESLAWIKVVMNFVMERIGGKHSLDDILDEFENTKSY